MVMMIIAAMIFIVFFMIIILSFISPRGEFFDCLNGFFTFFGDYAAKVNPAGLIGYVPLIFIRVL